MTNEIMMNALVAKRAEILFEIRKAEERIAHLQTELIHLDAVPRMFRPDFRAEGLRWGIVGRRNRLISRTAN